MPLKIELSVGADKFTADGDFTMADVVPAINEWGRLIGLPPGQDDIDRTAGKVSDSAEQLRSAVETSTPAAPSLKDA